MRVVAAVDSFKGSLDSRAAGQAVIAGVLEASADAEVAAVEVADGGEGTLDALLHPNEGRYVDVDAYDAVGRPIATQIGVYERAGVRRAVVECARTVGIELVTVDDTLPERGNSYGLGLQVLAARSVEADEVLVALGGSATTDGGTGLMQALGARILDENGVVIGREENPLWRFAGLDVSDMVDVATMSVTILSDVTNPLCGPRGAAAVFGPQKGARPNQVAHLDAVQRRWGEALQQAFDVDVVDEPGAGAAGGLGAALLAIGGTIQPGFDRVADEIGLPDKLSGADLVFTGEGSLDAQSAHGKVPSGVARLAREAGAIVVGVAGRVDRPLGEMSDLLDAAFGIHSEARPLSQALRADVTAAELRTTAFEVTRFLVASRHRPARSTDS